MSELNTVFHCPHCGHYTKGDAFWQGNTVPCPCGHRAWNVTPRKKDISEVATQFGVVNMPSFVNVDPRLLKRND